MWHDKRLILTESIILLCCATLVQMGCSGLTPVENVTVGTVAATVVGARSPSHEIEQIYYLGIFDHRSNYLLQYIVCGFTARQAS